MSKNALNVWQGWQYTVMVNLPTKKPEQKGDVYLLALD